MKGKTGQESFQNVSDFTDWAQLMLNLDSTEKTSKSYLKKSYGSN